MENYYIRKNDAGNRVLVIIDIVRLDDEPSISGDDFDAVYVAYKHKRYVTDMSMVLENLPMMSEKTWLKPFFLNTQFETRFSKYGKVLDGFANSSNDPVINSRIMLVNSMIERFQLPRKMIPATSTEDMFVNLCRYCVSRGETHLTNSSIKNFSEGFLRITSRLFGENDFLDKRLFFMQSLIDKGYIQQTQVLEKIHVCAVCRDSHLLFIETCPNCHGSNLKEERVIHHFRCANISPESTYQFDNELRCPKCKRFLRHIGVDYDMPASVYTCTDCGRSFTTPEMKVTCTQCERSYQPEDLSQIDVIRYEFTPAGLQALRNEEMNMNANNAVIDGYTNYDNFIDTMRTMAYSIARDSVYVVFVMRVTIPEMKDIQDRLMDIVQPMLYRLPNYKFTMKDNRIFIMRNIVYTDDEDVFNDVKEQVKEALTETFDEEVARKAKFDKFLRHKEDRSADFIKTIQE